MDEFEFIDSLTNIGTIVDTWTVNKVRKKNSVFSAIKISRMCFYDPGTNVDTWTHSALLLVKSEEKNAVFSALNISRMCF